MRPVAHLPARRTLADVVASLDAQDPAARGGVGRTIFAEQPWCPESPAVVLEEDAMRGRAPSMPSYAYLLEVDLAVEVLEVWSTLRCGTAPAPEQAADALVHYAAHATHQPATCQHHGCGRPQAGSCSTCRRSICSRHVQGSAPDVACQSCASGPASSRSGKPAGQPSVVRRGVLLAGVLSLALGLLLQSVPLAVGGTCLVIVGACIWLGSLVLRIMG